MININQVNDTDQYISALSSCTRLSARYSSKVINLSIEPFGVSSMTLVATVCMKVWS